MRKSKLREGKHLAPVTQQQPVNPEVKSRASRHSLPSPPSPDYSQKRSADPSSKHSPNWSKSPCRLTVVCHIEIGGFCPGTIARQGGGPYSHAVVPGGQPPQPAAPLQGEVPAGHTQVQLLEDRRRQERRGCAPYAGAPGPVGTSWTGSAQKGHTGVKAQSVPHARNLETSGILEPQLYRQGKETQVIVADNSRSP